MTFFACDPHPKNSGVNFSTSPQGGGEVFFAVCSFYLPLAGRSDCKAIRVGGAE